MEKQMPPTPEAPKTPGNPGWAAEAEQMAYWESEAFLVGHGGKHPEPDEKHDTDETDDIPID